VIKMVNSTDLEIEIKNKKNECFTLGLIMIDSH
jgi:hypothetical protein